MNLFRKTFTNRFVIANKLDYSTRPFQFNEILLCKNYKKISSKKFKFTQRLIKLTPNIVFQNKTFDIFHEHIKFKSEFNCSHKNESTVSFKMHSDWITFKRPTLYEYILLKEQQAVSSHFSIISLVPMLLELKTCSKVLECGTGSGSMTMFLSEKIGHTGELHTFDITESKVLKAQEYFNEWKESYDLRASNEYEKWPSNVKYHHLNLCNHEFNQSEYYDSIYLDMAETDKALANAYKLLKKDGILVMNALHLTQIMKCLNEIKSKGYNLENELIMEPSNRFWEIRKVHENDASSGEDPLKWTCRLEDRFEEKFKRAGSWFNYWAGFLVKLRKIK